MLLRLASYWGKPEFLMKRAAGLWQQFNDEGTMDLLHIDDRVVRLEVRDIVQPRASFCCVLTGWCSETATALGITHVRATHVECLALGGRRCIWEVRGVVTPGGVLAGGRGPDS